MTVSSTTTRVTYTGNGVTTAFATTFPFFGADEIEVIERVVATGGETVKTLTTHYTVSGGNGATGTVTAAGGAPSSAVQWIIRRKTARTQEIDYTPNDPFPAETHEQGLDRLKMNVQELGEENDRALKFPKTDSAGLSGVIPSSVARAGKYLAFDADGNPVAAGVPEGGNVVSAFMVTVLDDTDAAAARSTLGIESDIDITGLTALTAPAADDELPIYDLSATANRKITLADLMKIINVLTEDTSPDTANDFLLIYDASASGAKKVKPSNIITAPPYLKYSSTQANGVSGPTYTAGAWRTVSLSGEDADSAGIGSLSSSQVTLPAGTYDVYGDVIFTGDATHGRSRIYNATDSAVLATGINEQGSSAGGTDGHAICTGRFTLPGFKAIELQFFPKVTTSACAAVSSGEAEVYAVLEFRKVA